MKTCDAAIEKKPSTAQVSEAKLTGYAAHRCQLPARDRMVPDILLGWCQ